MIPASDEFVVPMSRPKLLAFALGSFAFVCGGAWMIRDAAALGWTVEMMIFLPLSLATAAFFGLIGVYAVQRLIRPEPAIVINRQGIVDNASLVSVGFIPWDNILEIQETQYNSSVFLGIVPKNLDALLAQQPAWKRMLIRANKFLTGFPVAIPQTVLPLTVSDLLSWIEIRSFR